MDEGAHGRRAGHRVGQPGLQREAERTSRGRRRAATLRRQSQAPIRPAIGEHGALHEVLDVQRVQLSEQEKQPDRQRNIAEACHDEGLRAACPFAGSRYQNPISR